MIGTDCDVGLGIMETLPSLPDEDQSELESDFQTTLDSLNRLEESVADDLASESTGSCCEKCNTETPVASDGVTICRSCGWYASLGTFVDVDPDWEKEEGQEEEGPKRSHLQVWWNLIPSWAWILVASLSAVIAENVAALLMTEPDTWERTRWSVTQLAIGGLIFVGCHIIGLIVFTIDDADAGLLDMLIKPIRLWFRLGKNLPNRLWLVNVALSSYLAVMMSTSVLGGIPYERLLDWGIEQPPKKSLMGAVVNQMQKVAPEEEEKSLEEAITDFAGTAGDIEPKTPKKPEPLPELDCVILGYRVDEEGRLTMLILGAEYQGKLKYAGRVQPKLSKKKLAKLGQLLEKARTKRPLLRLHTSAIWVKAKYACRVTYKKRDKGGRIIGVQWEKLLGKISF